MRCRDPLQTFTPKWIALVALVNVDLVTDRGLTRYLSVLLGVRSYQRRNFTVPMVFEEHVKKNPSKVAFVFEGKEWTFKMVTIRSNSTIMKLTISLSFSGQ